MGTIYLITFHSLFMSKNQRKMSIKQLQNTKKR